MSHAAAPALATSCRARICKSKGYSGSRRARWPMRCSACATVAPCRTSCPDALDPDPARMAAGPPARRRRRGRHAQLSREDPGQPLRRGAQRRRRRSRRRTGAAAPLRPADPRHHAARQERHRLAARTARARLRRRGGADHRLRRPRHRDRGAARRRQRLHPQALSRHADPQRGAPRPRTRAAAARELGAAPHAVAAHAAGRRPGGPLDRHQGPAERAAARGRGEQHGAADGRIGHRQGTRRARPAPQQPAPRRALRAGELRDHVARACRAGTVRPCARRSRRSRAGPRRAVRLCAGRHAVPRRDRRPAAAAAGHAAARAGRPAHPPGGQRAADPGGRAHRRRHQPAPGRRGGRRPLPRRPVLPAAGGGDQPAAAALAQGRHPRPRRALRRHARAAARRGADGGDRGGARLPRAVRLAGQRARAAQPDRALADPRCAQRLGAVPGPGAHAAPKPNDGGRPAHRPAGAGEAAHPVGARIGGRRQDACRAVAGHLAAHAGAPRRRMGERPQPRGTQPRPHPASTPLGGLDAAHASAPCPSAASCWPWCWCRWPWCCRCSAPSCWCGATWPSTACSSPRCAPTWRSPTATSSACSARSAPARRRWPSRTPCTWRWRSGRPPSWCSCCSASRPARGWTSSTCAAPTARCWSPISRRPARRPAAPAFRSADGATRRASIEVLSPED